MFVKVNGTLTPAYASQSGKPAWNRTNRVLGGAHLWSRRAVMVNEEPAVAAAPFPAMERNRSMAETERHPRGGMYFDDFVVGHLYEHRLRRTVTQMDNMLFSNMTLNPQPLHIDRHFCE